MNLKKVALGLVVAMALVGCGGNKDSVTTPSVVLPSGSVTEPLSGTVKITMDDFAVMPTLLFVKQGTIIEVTNNDIAGHSLTADNDSFDTGILGKGKSANLTMSTVGTFTFHCLPHPTTSELKGTITVVE